MAAINGTSLTLYIPQIDSSTTPPTATSAWIPIGLAKSASLSISADTPDISTKDSSAWTEVMAGMKSFSIDFEALMDLTTNTDASANNFKPLYDYFTNRLTIKVAFGKDATYWYGDAIISSLEQSAEAEQPVSYSGSLTGTGALTYGTASPIAYPS